MPIFDFVCRECDQAFEELIQGSSQPCCPSCGSKKLEKKLSGFAVAMAGPKTGGLPVGPCGSCGHPDGPGACRMD
jgi:putative FmdB family regulatory protein